ncbi:hypothetical protein Bca52824_027519 [Brassica carinata]|uniref:At2g35280-like TPR domain-containing protein n=1 Tax=Brassica carinata TaxID=52824 RepID=A0A8X7VAM3_BRACI|nr:hypothetical protein Bca52824_027519 [Brassica carinata]
MPVELCLPKAASDLFVYMINNLHLLAVNPLASLHRYNDLMERCLASGNFEAHYIRGVQRVFSQNNTERGLPHLHNS